MLMASYSATFNSDIILSATGACVYLLLGIIVERFLFTSGLLSFNLPLCGLLLYGCVAATSNSAFPVIFPNLLLIDLISYCLGFYIFGLATFQRATFILIYLACLLIYSRFYLAPNRYQHAEKAANVPLQTLTLYDLKGKPYTLQTTQNQVVLTDFWFIGCVQCMEKLPYIEELSLAYKSDPRVTFVAVALGKYNTLSQIQQFIKKHNFKIKVLYDKDNQVANSVKFIGAPLELIINNDSVQYKMSGFSRDVGLIYQRETRSRIDSLLGKN